jgi:outer membrane protein OmpU
MKKILLATTMLTATAGIASAEMTISGDARMGVLADIVNTYDADGHLSNSTVQTAFSSRFRISFTGSGTTDGGLTFGASARADNAAVGRSTNAQNETAFGGGAVGGGSFSNGRWMNAGSVYLAGTFGTLTMGDTGNAADDLVGQVSYVGYTSLNSWNEIGNLGRNETGVEYSYSANGFTFALGAGQTFSPTAWALASLPGTTAGEVAATYDNNNFWAAGFKYATDAFSVALGYQTNNGGDIVSASGSYTFSGATFKLKLADDSTIQDTLWAISADYTVDGVGLTAYYNSDSEGLPVNADPNNDNTMGAAYGIGASYDLGGGASVKAGLAQRDGDGYGSIFDLGVDMSF